MSGPAGASGKLMRSAANRLGNDPKNTARAPEKGRNAAKTVPKPSLAGGETVPRRRENSPETEGKTVGRGQNSPVNGGGSTPSTGGKHAPNRGEAAPRQGKNSHLTEGRRDKEGHGELKTLLISLADWPDMALEDPRKGPKDGREGGKKVKREVKRRRIKGH